MLTPLEIAGNVLGVLTGLGLVVFVVGAVFPKCLEYVMMNWRPYVEKLPVLVFGALIGLAIYDYWNIRQAAMKGQAAFEFLSQRLQAQQKPAETK